MARAVYGRSITLGESASGVILREPVGVVAVITPWNWPLTLLVRSLAPALAAGNACVVKPASLTSAVTIAALELLARDPELPNGVIRCVLGPGSEVGEALVANEDVDMIAFTGESATGTRVMKQAADGMRKVALELGGKSPNIVFADADLKKALAGAENAAFTTSGQICTAGSRLLIENAIYEEFTSQLCDVVGNLRVGDGLDERSQLGPVVSAQQAEKILEYVNLGRDEGEILAGGHQLTGPQHDRGHFIAPTVIGELPDSSRLLQEEIFGPVVTVQPFAGEEQAVSIANRTEYGLAAGLWTQNLDRAWRVASELEVGTVWVNTYHHFYDEAEVGGFKQSGLGRQQGIEGLQTFTETKHLNFDRSPTLW
jgi:betaine-aldehyde dehydrogenase